MPDITDAQAIKFSNEEMRKAADLMAGAYQQAKAIQIKWIAEGMGAKFPDTADDIMDGAHTDGRTILTSANVNELKDALDAFITLMEQNTNAHQVAVVRASVNVRT